MTNPPSWRPEGLDEPLGVNAISGGRSIPKPLSGRTMAGLVGAILAALGVAAYAAGDFLDVDPVETASVSKEPIAAPVAKATAASEATAPDRVALAAPKEPLPVATPRSPVSAQTEPQPIETSSNKADRALPKAAIPVPAASTALVPPTSAAQVAGLAPDVEVAESEAEVAALETAIGMAEPAPESEMEVARLERASSPSEAALIPEEGDTTAMGGPFIPVTGFQSTRVSRHVNLRAGPADEARVVAVIPANATVQAETNCGWCAVTYNGKSGYIYKGFLNGRGGGGAKSTGSRSRAARKLTGKPGLY